MAVISAEKPEKSKLIPKRKSHYKERVDSESVEVLDFLCAGQAGDR